ncbi:hypothetical protein AXF42_Ash004428 [Apostasia shenzhenica]|uniref:Cystatin domain-containing protein n=1 Tax=Apostasia shenzhenica TaxID=1088818 RepID=A0A2I0A2X0_9ASPA|nr:hypothetical protein AXF42_Ash004428 [Apostasia shenzhenica]
MASSRQLLFILLISVVVVAAASTIDDNWVRISNQMSPEMQELGQKAVKLYKNQSEQPLVFCQTMEAKMKTAKMLMIDENMVNVTSYWFVVYARMEGNWLARSPYEAIVDVSSGPGASAVVILQNYTMLNDYVPKSTVHCPAP